MLRIMFPRLICMKIISPVCNRGKELNVPRFLAKPPNQIFFVILQNMYVDLRISYTSYGQLIGVNIS